MRLAVDNKSSLDLNFLMLLVAIIMEEIMLKYLMGRLRMVKNINFFGDSEKIFLYIFV